MIAKLFQMLAFPGSVRDRCEEDAWADIGFDYNALPMASGHRLALFTMESKTASGTLAEAIYFYGNGMTALYAAAAATALAKRGFRCHVPDYPGYGWSTGRPSPLSFREMENTLVSFFEQRPSCPRLIIGWSLGSLFAMRLAAQTSATALVLLSGFDSMKQVAATKYRLPASLLSFLPWCPDANPQAVPSSLPIFLAHGEDDSLVTPATSVALAAQFTSERHRCLSVFLPAVGHQELLSLNNPAFEAALDAFVAQHFPGQ